MDTNQSFVERYLTPIAVLLGALLIALAVAYGRGAIPSTDTQNPPAGEVSIDAVKVEGEPFIGDPNAPVTMAFFFDYQCPFCKQFDQMITPKLYDEFVKTGKLKIVFKDFQFLGPDSLTGALYGRAVWELYPNQFYAWYTAMAEAQDEEGGGFGDEATVSALTAKVAGIDGARVSALVAQKSTEYQAAITADRDEATALHINGTPSVIIGSQLLSGLAPEAFYAAIKAEVEKGG